MTCFAINFLSQLCENFVLDGFKHRSPTILNTPDLRFTYILWHLDPFNDQVLPDHKLYSEGFIIY